MVSSKLLLLRIEDSYVIVRSFSTILYHKYESLSRKCILFLIVESGFGKKNYLAEYIQRWKPNYMWEFAVISTRFQENSGGKICV